MNEHITEFIAENEDGYFTARLDNGGVRIGLRGANCFAFPADHAEYTRVVALRADEIEAAHDEFMGAYIAQRAAYAAADAVRAAADAVRAADAARAADAVRAAADAVRAARAAQFEMFVAMCESRAPWQVK